MVQFTSLLAAAVLASSAYATPTPGWPSWGGPKNCLTPEIASGLVNGFGSLISAYTTANANNLLAPNFTDTSDSIDFLGGYPEGTVTFPSKAAFEAGQGTQRPIPFTVINIDAVTCNTVAYRWYVTIGAYKLKGINIFTAENSGDSSVGVSGWQIETNYSEFNSGLWTEAIGGVCTPPKE